MTTAVLSLGSNMGDPQGYLSAAVAELQPMLRAASSVYRTPPWGPVPQDSFRNMVVIVADPEVDAIGWWEWAQRLESAAHRERIIRWGPRTLDVDVIAVWREPGDRADDGVNGAAGRATACGSTAGDVPGSAGYDLVLGRPMIPVLSADATLLLPHPRAAGRGFVLVPWAEIDPDAVLPGHGPVADLLARADLAGIDRIGSLVGS